METKRVLAAPGRRVIFAPVGRVRRRLVGGPNGERLSCAVWIGDDGLYDASNRETPSAPGPVAVPWDARHQRLVADGDLVVAAAAEEAKPRLRGDVSPRERKE